MNHTDPTPEPIRKSSLPCTPPPEWEFYTWFPHPDGGGDMVPGERQRGILVRRRVTYSDWEPVRPDHWADEPEPDTAAAPADQTERRDQYANAIRDRVRFRFGASVLALAGQGRPIKMTPSEAEAAAAAVMAVADAEQVELRTQNARMRHELEVMYGGAFDSPAPTAEAAASVVVSPPPDHATLRDRVRQALCEQDGKGFAWGTDMLEPDEYGEVADAVLAVLPESGRAATLLEAAEAVGRMDYDQDSSDYGYDSYRDAWDGGVMDATETLRRLAAEAPQPDTEARPPQHAWRVELHDPLADQWGHGSPLRNRQDAVERYAHASKHAGRWLDGTPVERRLVRETTTYTVEEPAVSQPAAEAHRCCGKPAGAVCVHDLRQQPAADGGEETEVPVHACPPDGTGLTPCCGRPPFELPTGDRMTTEPTAITCSSNTQEMR